jgi:glutathione synthase/RimK-type ligase-like ATP-grasp enzyme
MSELDRVGAPAKTVDFSGLEDGAPYALRVPRTSASITYRHLKLEQMAAAYIRQLPGAWPPLGMQADGQAVVLRKWMTPWMLAREREVVVTATLQHLHHTGTLLLNPPAAGIFAQNKLTQLVRGKTLGLPLPDTLVTNNVDDAVDFLIRHPRAIAKPAHGGALTQELCTRGKSRRALHKTLHAIGAAPVILQERVDGADVRLFMLDGKVLSCCALALDDGPWVDFRASPAYQAGRTRYVPVKLPSEVRTMAGAWARQCGLRFAGLDLKETSAGRLVFLECNSSPIYRDQELKTGDAISRALASWLVAAARTSP